MIPTPSPSIGGTPIFVAFIALTFYGLGAGYLESFVNYPLWYIVGETDGWVAYHQALGPSCLAIPALALSLIANVLLCVLRPPALPASSVAATLSLLLVGTASTMVIQIPVQTTLDVAYDCAALDRLISSSLWLRDIPGGIRRSSPPTCCSSSWRARCASALRFARAQLRSFSPLRRVVDDNLDWETMSRFGYEKGDGGD